MTNLPVIQSEITYLEMLGKPSIEDVSLDEHSFQYISTPDVKTYLNLYREIGRDYIWNYRPGQTEQEIEQLIQSDNTRLYYLYDGQTAIGMAEIDCSKPDALEIVHFGLLPAYIDKGIGKKFFAKTLQELWQGNVRRVWLSTCGMDHPKAIEFYQNAGFEIFKTKMGEFLDYRHSGFYDLKDAPRIPLALSLKEGKN